MFIRLNQTLGLPVISQESGNRLGRVKDLIIDYETGEFLALLVGEGILTSLEIVEIDKVNNFLPDRVMVRDDTSLEILESGRIQEIIQSKIKIKGNKVMTESGTDLGKVTDFEINLNSNRLSSISVKNKILGKPLIISYNQIISIEKDAIIVKDGVVKIKTFEPELARV